MLLALPLHPLFSTLWLFMLLFLGMGCCYCLCVEFSLSLLFELSEGRRPVYGFVFDLLIVVAVVRVLLVDVFWYCSFRYWR